MNRTLAMFCTGVSLLIGGWVAEGVRLGTESTLADAPPEPPRFHAAGRPAYDVVSGVCVVRDADGAGSPALGYGGYWYANRDGYWFRSRSFAGPYQAVDPERVPSKILRVPPPESRHASRS